MSTKFGFHNREDSRSFPTWSIGKIRLARDVSASDYSDTMNPSLLRDRIMSRLAATGKKAIPVAEHELGKGRDYLSDFLKGNKDSLKADVLPALAKALDCSLEYLTDPRTIDPDAHGGVRNGRTVPLVGYVGAGSAAHFYASGDGELDRIEAPEYANEHTVAAKIQGPSVGPLFDGWLVFWDEVRSPVTPDMLGELCVIGLPDDRILVKQLKAASAPGLFHLLSNNEAPMLDQEVMWAAKVKGMQPR